MRVRNTRQVQLTPEQIEEKRIANFNFFQGNLTDIYFKNSSEIHNFVLGLCRSKGFTPCAYDKKSNQFVPTPGSKHSKKIGCPFYIYTSLTKNGYHVSSFDARHNHENTENVFLMQFYIEE